MSRLCHGTPLGSVEALPPGAGQPEEGTAAGGAQDPEAELPVEEGAMPGSRGPPDLGPDPAWGIAGPASSWSPRAEAHGDKAAELLLPDQVQQLVVCMLRTGSDFLYQWNEGVYGTGDDYQ